ncbi:MAG: MYXO-CTERM sorting domain-containing protein [Nannocystaceae bacterium]
MRVPCLPLLPLLTVLAGGLVAPLAHADVIDPAEEACDQAGDACTVGGRDGVCKAQTCARLDYSNPGPDGTPGTSEYDCVRCVEGEEPAEPEATPEPTPEAAPEGGPSPAKASPEPSSSAKGTRCAVGPTTTSLLSFGLGLGLLGLAVRRRR